MPSISTFPISADQLDPGSLSALLGSALPAGAGVSAVRVTPLGEGQGLLGDLSVVDVDYRGDTELPTSFVVKFPAANPASRATARRAGLYLARTSLLHRARPGSRPLDPSLLGGPLRRRDQRFRARARAGRSPRRRRPARRLLRRAGPGHSHRARRACMHAGGAPRSSSPWLGCPPSQRRSGPPT